MWRPYLNVIAAKVGQALHVLDRFHITSHLNQALDQVRRAESGRLRAAGRPQAEQLKNMRWKLLRRPAGCAGGPDANWAGLLRTKLDTARAWALKDLFEHFWTYKSVRHAGDFLDYLDLARLAQPPRADEEGGADAAHS